MIIYRGYTKYGVFGDWHTEEGDFICHSLEREWEDNTVMISCIPEGVYELVPHDSPKFGATYALIGEGVGLYEGDAKRTGILIHKANWAYQLRGCIAPVTDYGILSNKWAGKNSGDAMEKVFAHIEAGDTKLDIRHKPALSI